MGGQEWLRPFLPSFLPSLHPLLPAAAWLVKMPGRSHYTSQPERPLLCSCSHCCCRCHQEGQSHPGEVRGAVGAQKGRRDGGSLQTLPKANGSWHSGYLGRGRFSQLALGFLSVRSGAEAWLATELCHCGVSEGRQTSRPHPDLLLGETITGCGGGGRSSSPPPVEANHSLQDGPVG